MGISAVVLLSAGGVYLWGSQSFTRPILQPLVVLAVICLGVFVLGPLRPLILPFTAVLTFRLIQLIWRGSRGAKEESNLGLPTQKKRRLRVAVPILLTVATHVYVVIVDQKANESWGREFAGLEEFDGRAIQQLTVVSDSSEWSYEAYWFYIKSVNDACVTAGFEAGQYWPATAMQCPDGIRQLAGTFKRHYPVDYLRSIGSHWSETSHDYSTAWHFIDLPAGFGYDIIPTWLRGVLLNPTASDSDSPFVLFWVFALITGAYLVIFVVRRWKDIQKKDFQFILRTSKPKRSNLLVPYFLVGASMFAILLTIIYSPGDPRVAVVHSTGARIWVFVWVFSALDYATKPKWS